jgi:hypothetical protein
MRSDRTVSAPYLRRGHCSYPPGAKPRPKAMRRFEHVQEFLQNIGHNGGNNPVCDTGRGG